MSRSAGVALDLLGAHVGQRAHQLARSRLQGGDLDIGSGSPGNAEIQHLRLTAGRPLRFVDHQDVARFEVAMDHAFLMSMLDGIADSSHQFETLVYAEQAPAGVLDQRLALDEFHREKRLATAACVGFTGLVDLGDAGVLEAAQHVALVFETPQRVARLDARFDDLQGHDAPRHVLPGPIDHAHAALAEHIENGVLADLLGEAARQMPAPHRCGRPVRRPPRQPATRDCPP